MPVIGTAGHVDHGKSTLVQALTGRDPDRLIEEKRRGMTIDLGFAWTTLRDQIEVSFVDVPGHETLLKNMLAGTVGIDIALLVVAADEGWKPQTDEHFAVLNLLRIPSCVVAVTKTDLVDHDRIQQAVTEVAANLDDTPLADAPIVPLSAFTGDGVSALVDVLTAMAASITVDDTGRPRLWVDRSFIIAGAGTVITGTLVGGSLIVGDKVEIWPHRTTARIRSLQSHERSIEHAIPGRRVAISLAGVGRGAVRRGSMISYPDQWESSSRVLATLTAARYADPIRGRAAHQFHIGTAVTTGQLQPIIGNDAVIRLNHPQPLQIGDGLIIRDVGRRQVVGAAQILDPAPATNTTARRSLPSLAQIANSDPERQATTLLNIRNTDTVARLYAHSGGGTPQGLIVGNNAYSHQHSANLQRAAHDLVNRHHTDHPLDSGIPKAALANQLGIPLPTLDALIGEDTALQVRGGIVAVTLHKPTITAQHFPQWETARHLLEQAGLQPPPTKTLGLSDELLHHVHETGQLFAINQTYSLLPKQVQHLLHLVDQLPQPFTVADFRDTAGITRRHAIPYLEWADANQYTRRIGDRRIRTRGGGGRESNPPGVATTPQRF